MCVVKILSSAILLTILLGQDILNMTLSKSLQRKFLLSDGPLNSVTANTTQFLNSIQVADCS